MEIKVGDSRFDRHYRRIQLGLRLLSHGARAQTASEWSELTPDRLVTLKRRWLPEAGEGFRGPAPTSYQPFFRSALRNENATIFACICRKMFHDAVSDGSRMKLRPSLENAERLCEAYELFRQWMADADMEFDQAVLLARGLAERKDIELTHCPNCERPMLIDTLARRQEVCGGCRRRPANPR